MRRVQSILLTTTLVASIVSFSLGWFFAKNVETGSSDGKSLFQTLTGTSTNADSPFRIPNLSEVWGKLQESYYDGAKLDLPKLEAGAVKGFVRSIGDDYTVYMTPDESKDFNDTLEGQLEGIGAQLEAKNGKLVVVAPIKNSPAERAGIKAGDIILKIDGKLAENMTLYEAIMGIRGKKSTMVTLTVLHEKAAEPTEVKIERDAITIDTVTLKKLDNDIFYLSLNEFNNHTKNEFNNAVQKILLEKARGLIIDVRGNGGGYLTIAVDMISDFIDGKRDAVMIKKRDQSKNETVKTSGAARLPDIPLVVLANKGSASASEILAGALQDYKRAVVIGEQTFGKGSVQEIDQLNDGSTLRITIAKWFTPLGRSISEVGIKPDKEVTPTEDDIKQGKDPQLDEAVKYLTTRR